MLKIGQISVDTGFDLFDTPLDLAAGEIAIATVDGLELTAVDRDQRLREQVESTAQHDELTTYPADCRAVVLAELRDCLEIRGQPTRQPHEFNIALTFAFQPPAGLHSIQVAVDINFEKRCRMIA